MFDDELWPFAQTEQRLFITTDKGFSEHRDEKHCGILVVRLRQAQRAADSRPHHGGVSAVPGN